MGNSSGKESVEAIETKQLIENLEIVAVNNRQNSFKPSKNFKRLLHFVWEKLFCLEPPLTIEEKYSTIEQLLLRPLIFQRILEEIQNQNDDLSLQKKILDIFMFANTYSSNDASDSCIPRKTKEEDPIKWGELLYQIRKEFFDVARQKYECPRSPVHHLLNKTLAISVQQEDSLEHIFRPLYTFQSGRTQLQKPIIFYLLDFLHPNKDDESGFSIQFDHLHGILKAIEILLNANNKRVSLFAEKNCFDLIAKLHNALKSPNWLIKGKISQILYELLSTENLAEFRDIWLHCHKNFQIVVQNMLISNKYVQRHSVSLFEIFIFNLTINDKPKNARITKFLRDNHDKLVRFFSDLSQRHQNCRFSGSAENQGQVKNERELKKKWGSDQDRSEFHNYKGSYLDEVDEARYERILWKLFNMNSPVEREELEKQEEWRNKMLTEQTFPTPDLENESSSHQVIRRYHDRCPQRPQHLREPMVIGNCRNSNFEQEGKSGKRRVYRTVESVMERLAAEDRNEVSESGSYSVVISENSKDDVFL